MSDGNTESPPPSLPVKYVDVLAAVNRISNIVSHTPALTSSTFDELSGKKLFFKCEIFQKTGSFKIRGASNAVMLLPEDVARNGVVCHSSGNHAGALAYAARMRGIPAYVVMPSNSSEVKVKAVEGYGGTVIKCEPTLAAREAECARVVEEKGATMIHSYNNLNVIAGQGTIAYELMNLDTSAPSFLDALIVPVGGGGMLSGICVAAKAINPNIRIFAAEPLGADDAKRSLESGSLVPCTNPQTVADGLRTSLGSNTWPIVKENVERVITVTEEEIVNTMKLVWERMKLVIESSAAVAVAVALSEEFKALKDIEHVGVILCGGNVDLDDLPWLKK